MKNVVLILSFLASGAAFGQQEKRVLFEDLASCPEKALDAYREFKETLAQWNGAVAVKVLQNTAKGDALQISMAEATGRGNQLQDSLAYGLMQYCNALKKVEDEVQ